MGKDIKLNSSEWCDVVFEGKNKQYGAYKLRQSSSKRHIVAFLVILLFAGIVSALPGLISEIKKLTQNQQENIDETFELSNIPVEDIPEENKIMQETAPPPPPLKTTVQFVPPTIAKDEEVTDQDVMKSQDEIQGSKIQISVASVQGTSDKGVDIAELREHKVIVEEKQVEEKPFVTVEQMPTFPGGEVEMQKFIRDNLRYPVVAQEAGIQGRVTLRFVVSKTDRKSVV